jgi:hypothetical protein
MPGIRKTMDEFKAGKLHSGSKTGPEVKSRAQAIAIGLSEQRKEKEHMKPKHHSMMGSNLPFGAATHGKPNEHEQPVGHKVEAGHKTERDGAGRHGADESGHRSYSEHKEPHHPAGSHTKQHEDAPKSGHGPFGYPGAHMQMDHEHQLIGGNYKQSDHEPAVLKHEPGPNGWAGMHAGLGTQPHGFGHQKSQKSGQLRMSGHPGAHRVGKR